MNSDPKQTAAKITGVRILTMPTYKPGDLPPDGYLQWHEWAEVQRKAGIKQVECPTCSKWRTPQELSSRKIKWGGKDRYGNAIDLASFQCTKCFEREPVTNG